MDNRSSVRLPVHTDVDIQFPGHGFLAARTRDISHKGMFVDTGGIYLPPHALVNVRVWTEYRHQATYFQMLGVVAHRTRRGVGLMYVHGLEKAYRQLQALMKNHLAVV